MAMVHSARPFAGTTEAAIPVLAAAREALAGHPAEAAPRVAEIRLLLDVADRLSDLPAAARSVIEAALETAEAALTRWGA